MINYTYAAFSKEYATDSGVLIIENITKGNKKKTDVIREILENTACLVHKNLVQSTCRNTADYGSQTKEAEN